MTTDLAALPSFSATWSSASAESDLEQWASFLARAGVRWSPNDRDRAFVRDLAARSTPHVRNAIELRLSKLAHDALSAAGDDRRLYKQAPSTWYLLTRAQAAELRAAGHALTTPPSPLAMLATIPITLGAYIGTSYACRAAGLAPELAWVVALVVWALTHRALRGRWPFQVA
jgi:hypothetical protein